MKALFLSLLLTGTAALAHAQSANVKTAMDGYARFGQGDIPGILATLADNIVWVHAGNPAIVAFAGTYNGPAEVGQFFEKVGATIQVTVFNPTNFSETGNTVRNDVHIEGTVLATGKTFSSDMVMTWAFDPAGKATRWEAAGDMSAMEAAFSK